MYLNFVVQLLAVLAIAFYSTAGNAADLNFMCNIYALPSYRSLYFEIDAVNGDVCCEMLEEYVLYMSLEWRRRWVLFTFSKTERFPTLVGVYGKHTILIKS